MKLTYLITHIVFCSLMLVGCSSQQRPLIHKGIVYNQTGIEIKEFKLVHLPTHGTLGLSGILANDRAEIGISPKVLMGTEAQLSWNENGIHKAVSLDLQTLIGVKSVKSVKSVKRYILIYTLLPGGRASVKLKPYAETQF